MDKQAAINRRTFLKLTAATIAAGLPYGITAAQSGTAGCAPYGMGAYGAGAYSVGACVPTGVTVRETAATTPSFWLHGAIVAAAITTVRKANGASAIMKRNDDKS